ncbi:uncharacterized protein LOC103574342 isoform X2 [Microplitis demolitor]|uniref:uncharacterized protein LOC103574342 isoform X2 n=1 Tax=Microplitis demolitor TaxID=69319 RepID=UPI0004CD5ED9|nr:uncharacterized protein LOC103574342 isoform X2 [Microplitis demolitor]
MYSSIGTITVALLIADCKSYEIKSKKKIGFSKTPWYSQSTHQQPSYGDNDSTGSVTHNNDNDDNNNYGDQSGSIRGETGQENNRNKQYPEYWIAVMPNIYGATDAIQAGIVITNRDVKKPWKLLPADPNFNARSKLLNCVIRFPTIWIPEPQTEPENTGTDDWQTSHFRAVDTGDNVSIYKITNDAYGRTDVAPVTLEVDFSTPVMIWINDKGLMGLMVKVRPAKDRNARTYFRQRY